MLYASLERETKEVFRVITISTLTKKFDRQGWRWLAIGWIRWYFLYGDDGDDLLWGGLGDDRLQGDDFSGGVGSDIFVHAPGEGTDTIVDFEIGTDLIGLEKRLSFGQLSFQGNEIRFEDKTLAVLSGINTTTLTESSFVGMK